MASKKFLDGIPPEEGVKYQLVTGGDNKTTITNITNWSQTPTEMRANDFIQGMVLLCDHSKVGVTHNLTNPNSVVGMVRAKVGAGQEVEDGDTFTFNGAPLTVVGEIPDIGEGEYLIATIDGSTINFKSGGGGGVQLQVVASTAQPANPKEGTVWVNTSVPMLDKHAFIVAAGFTVDTLPEGYIGVQASLAKNSIDTFSVLKKSDASIQVTRLYQKIDNVLVALSGSVYANGQWQSLDKSIFYEAGVQYYPMITSPAITTPTPLGTVTFLADSIEMYTAVTGAYNALGFSQAFDVSGMSKLYLTMYGDNGNSWAQSFNFGLYSANLVTFGGGGEPGNAVLRVSTGASSTQRTLELDVSSISGSYYIIVTTARSTHKAAKYYITKMWYEE